MRTIQPDQPWYAADKVPTAAIENTPRPKAKSAPQQSRGPPQRILRWREVRARVGLSRATIWRKVRSADFPVPVRLGPQSVGWIECELDEWVEERAAERAGVSFVVLS